MGMTLVMKPSKLAWSNFQVVNDPILENGQKRSAKVDFTYEYPDYTPVRKDGKFALPDSITLTIEPDARIWKDSEARKDKAKAADLLTHEQFHYDVAHAIGRVVLMHMWKLRADSEALLKAGLDLLLTRHFETRAGLIQRRYDLETRHGQDKHYQRIWIRLMEQTLANPNATMIGGYWL